MSPLTLPILGLVLLAAVAHAAWNLLAVLAEGEGRLRFAASAAIVVGVVALTVG